MVFGTIIIRKGYKTNNMQQSPFLAQKTSIEKLNIEQEKTNLGNSVLLARSEVPDSHRRIADSYMILKTH